MKPDICVFFSDTVALFNSEMACQPFVTRYILVEVRDVGSILKIHLISELISGSCEYSMCNFNKGALNKVNTSQFLI